MIVIEACLSRMLELLSDTIGSLYDWVDTVGQLYPLTCSCFLMIFALGVAYILSRLRLWS